MYNVHTLSTNRLFIDMMLNERATSKVRVKLDLMAEVSDNVNSIDRGLR